MSATADVAHAADALTSWFTGVTTAIRTLSGEVAALLDRNMAGIAKVNQAALAGLAEPARTFLAQNAFAVGAGTFFAAASFEKGGHALEWWYRAESGGLARLDSDLTPGSARYYDYEKLPFFSTAAATGEQTVWGPYIDYLGFEGYILTFTAPFSVHGHFTGVTGCDIRLTDLEPLIMPSLLSIPGDAAVINASNRVILGNSGAYLVGERIKARSPEPHRVPLDVPHLGLALIYTAEPDTR